ncbi:methyltransferase domain-containing protein [Halorarum salinum]|uniref:Methyltransferase domain-containing protein n=1 Tax=Halorarum salinum TaxID=2743089 RepID=A0A7D5LCZ3_9EURY|nr:methyltransferase domain-containing protein [Halobaculum salinum]QLG63694.1 methyltransferase domain-containing protein [Halobaculum salinum]
MPMRERTGLDAAALLVLRAANETGVLDALVERAGTPAEVAAETDVTEAAAERTVGILADLGFLKRVGGEYEPTNRALGLLAKRDVRSVGAVPHALDVADALVALPGTMETGVPPEAPEDATANRLGAHAATDESVVRACVTAAVRAAPDAERVLDLCGGSGTYAAEFADRGRDVTLVDSPAVVEAVAPLHDRPDVRLHDGPPTTLEGSFDLAFGARVAGGMDPTEIGSLLEAARDALAPGGTLCLADVLADGSDAAVTADAVGLATGHGGAYDAERYREWFEEAGFVDVRIEPVPGTDRRAVSAVA